MSLISKLNKDYNTIRCMKNIRYRSDIGDTGIIDKTGTKIKFLDIIQYNNGYAEYLVVYSIKENNIILVSLDRIPLELYTEMSVKRFLEGNIKICGNFEDEYNLFISNG